MQNFGVPMRGGPQNGRNRKPRTGLAGSKFGGKPQGALSKVYSKFYSFIFPNTVATEEER